MRGRGAERKPIPATKFWREEHEEGTSFKRFPPRICAFVGEVVARWGACNAKYHCEKRDKQADVGAATSRNDAQKRYNTYVNPYKKEGIMGAAILLQMAQMHTWRVGNRSF